MYTDAGTTANFPLDVGDKEVKGSLDDGLINGPSDSSEVAKHFKVIYASYRFLSMELITNNKLALKNKEKIRARIVLKLLFFCSHSDLAYFFRITDPLFTSEI